MATTNTNERITVEDIIARASEYDGRNAARAEVLMKGLKKHDERESERSKTLMKGQKKVYDRVGLAERRILRALGIGRAELIGATLLGLASAIFAFIVTWKEAAEVGIGIRSIWSVAVGIMAFGFIVLIAKIVGGGKNDDEE